MAVADVERLTVEADIIDNALDAVVTNTGRIDRGIRRIAVSCAPIKGLPEITSLDPLLSLLRLSTQCGKTPAAPLMAANAARQDWQPLNTVMLRDEMSRHSQLG